MNLASRMESNGEVGKINISGAIKQNVDMYFETGSRGRIDVKNKGEVEMYFVTGIKVEYALDDKRRFPNDRLKQILEMPINATIDKKT